MPAKPACSARPKLAKTCSTSGLAFPFALASASISPRSLRMVETSTESGTSSPASALAILGPRTFSTFGPPELSENSSISQFGSKP